MYFAHTPYFFKGCDILEITFLRLKNFAAIHTGMGKKELIIDFSKCKNRVILLVGRNGSGKTALLSTLHPFAYPGSMDVRANSSMILQDKDGEKEIHYNKDGIVYIIKHFYKNSKKGISVKSFISKNDIELNPNGNVTSFVDIVSNELGIQQDYLKLLRLGSNVTNMIEMKAAERKSFTSDLFSELDIWSKLYKKVNEDSRLLKNLLSTVSNKLQRLHVIDRDQIINDISDIGFEISTVKSNMDELKKRLGVIEGKIQALVPEGVKTLKETIIRMDHELSSKLKDVDKYQRDINELGIIICGSVDTEIETLTTDINKLTTKNLVSRETINSYMGNMNDLMNERDDIQRQLSTLVSDDDIKSLKSIRDSIISALDDVPTKVKKYKPITTKDTLLTAIKILTEIDRIVSNTYEFGMDAVKQCIHLMRDGANIDKYIESEIVAIDKEVIDITAKYKANKINNACVVVFKPTDCCVPNCPYLDLYDRFFRSTDDDTPSVEALENKREYFVKIGAVYKNITYVGSLVKMNDSIRETLSNLNIDYLSMDSILDAMFSNYPVFNESVITKHINDIEEYNMYQKLLAELRDVESEIASSNSNDRLIDNLTARLSVITDKIDTIKIDIERIIGEITDRERTLSDMETYRDLVYTYKDIVDKLNTTCDDADKFGDELRDKKDIFDSVKTELSDLDMMMSQMTTYEQRYSSLQQTLMDKSHILKTYDELIEERDTLNDKFEEVAITREALSSTKGAPLLYIQLYLQSTTMFVNDILSTVYDDFEIDGFDISDTEFNIPYVKNGVRINDVSHASQGERSFLSLALSFALIHKSIQDYNIMLLDEIDSTLDTRNRAIFLNILMDMLDLIESEQTFLITHNNMFDSQPVDIIMTSDVNLDSYQNANIIYHA